MPASPLCCVRWSLAGSGSCPPGARRPRLQAQLPLQHHRAALPWLLPSVTYELIHLLTSFPFAIRIKANLSEHTASFLILHLRVQRSQSSVWHSRALYVPSCRKYPALIPAPPPRILFALKAAPSLPCQSVTASGLYSWAVGVRGFLSLHSASLSQPALPQVLSPRTSTPSSQQGAVPPAQGGKQVPGLSDHPLTLRVCSDCCWALDRPETQVSSVPAEGEPSHLEILVLIFFFFNC